MCETKLTGILPLISNAFQNRFHNLPENSGPKSLTWAEISAKSIFHHWLFSIGRNSNFKRHVLREINLVGTLWEAIPEII